MGLVSTLPFPSPGSTCPLLIHLHLLADTIRLTSRKKISLHEPAKMLRPVRLVDLTDDPHPHQLALLGRCGASRNPG